MGKNNFSKIAVVGLGYVGLSVAVEFAKKGIEVAGIEINPARVKAVNEGKSYLSDINNEVLIDLVRSGKLKAFQEPEALKNVDAIIVCVPTPLTNNKTPDTSYIISVSKQVVPFLHEGELVVLESTTYPGTTEEIVLPILSQSGLEPGEDFYLAFSPERVDPGNRVYRIENVPKVVGGINKESTDLAAMLYKIIVPKVFKVSSTKVAEMAKLLENIFRLVNVALINELAILSEKMDIDLWEVIDAAKTKPYGFMPFYPGPGIGGHCIPVDPFYLLWKAKEYNFDISFIELAEQINDIMPGYVVQKVSYALNSKKESINGSKILVIGVAYKENIDDTRESPALKIIPQLMRLGSDVSYFDPYVSEININGKVLKSIPMLSKEILNNADCSLILTAHSSINYDFILQNSDIIVDTRNAIRENDQKMFKLAGGRERF